MTKKVELIIVGQGIAGTILAVQCLLNKVSFVIVDKGSEGSSSSVAAGIMNPMVLKRLTKSWRTEEFIAYNTSFYRDLENLLGGSYFHPIAFKKLIQSDDEKHFWRHRQQVENLGDFLEESLTPFKEELMAKRAYLEGNVKGAAWLDLKLLLPDFRNYLIENKLIREEAFDFNSLSIQNGFAKYKNLFSNTIVFCEGHKVVDNPYFNSIPMSLNKGELITINSTEIKLESLVKKGIFILPLGNNNYKIGASFEWTWENNNPSKKQETLLKNQFKEISSAPFKIINHEAGIRPSAKNRRPIMGRHWAYRELAIFNGLGARGCFIAPLLSKELLWHLLKNEPLHLETSLERYVEN